MKKIKKWIKKTILKAIKDTTQMLIIMIGASIIAEKINWNLIINLTIISGILSILTSISNLK